jgi:hypothetical protein
LYKFLFALLIAVLPGTAFSEVACGDFKIPAVVPYTVKDGDTLTGIAVTEADVYTSAEDLICINEEMDAKVTKKWGDRPEPRGGPMWSHQLNPGDTVFIPVCPGGCTERYGVRIN